VTRLLWRSQARELPRAAWHALRRLARRESRWYLEIDGRVIGRFTCQADHDKFITWITATTTQTFLSGHVSGMEVAGAFNSEGQAHAGDTGTS